jgi:hypothetical protein
MAATVTNAGDATSTSSRLVFYLVPAGGSMADGIRLRGGRRVERLEPGQSRSVGADLLVPPAAVPGRYVVAACADGGGGGGRVAERDESNNCRIAGSPVLIAAPDLRVDELRGLPARTHTGAPLAVVDVTRNAGPVPVRSVLLQYYLSTTKRWSANATPLPGGRTIPALAPNATSTAVSYLSIPLTVPAGHYHLLACPETVPNASTAGSTCTRAGGRVTVLP